MSDQPGRDRHKPGCACLSGGPMGDSGSAGACDCGVLDRLRRERPDIFTSPDQPVKDAGGDGAVDHGGSRRCVNSDCCEFTDALDHCGEPTVALLKCEACGELLYPPDDKCLTTLHASLAAANARADAAERERDEAIIGGARMVGAERAAKESVCAAAEEFLRVERAEPLISFNSAAHDAWILERAAARNALRAAVAAAREG